MAAVVLLLLLERLLPRLPASLIVLAGAVNLAVGFFRGFAVSREPTASSAQSADVTPGRVALVAFAESYSIADRFARLHGDEMKADREMVAVGAVNLAVGFFRGRGLRERGGCCPAPACGATCRSTHEPCPHRESSWRGRTGRSSSATSIASARP